MLSSEINALPDRVRKYIAALETECDPSGTIRENFRLREENAGLRYECENLAKEHKMPVPPDYAIYGPTEEEIGASVIEQRRLSCPGVGRDKDCISALAFYFSRRVTDDEMRFLHEVMQRAVASIPTHKM